MSLLRPTAAVLLLSFWIAAQEADEKILPVTYYDFNAAHPDFQNAQCEGGKNMVQPVLDSARKPFHLPGNTCADNKLADWFRSGPDNATYCKSLRMTRKAGTTSTYEYHSDFFFPLDSVPTNENTYSAADGKTHNFHFCMELKGTFKYKGGEVFDFLGDDDVWMYINNRLALDLGGIHGAQPGTVRLDERKDELGLTVGQYYPFDFFFCERQTGRSSLKVTTDLDIVPPTGGQVHISDAQLGLLGAGDTLDLPKGGGPAVFKALQDWRVSQNVECRDVITEGRGPASGDWTLGVKPLPSGAEARIHPDSLDFGVHPLVFRKDGFSAILWIRVPGNPPLDTLRIHPDIQVSLLRGVNDGPPLQPKSGNGALVVHGGGACANCDQPILRPLLAATPIPALAGLGPTWEVKTLFPFRYALKVFDNLGHYVSEAEGEVGSEAFAAMRTGTPVGDSARIRLTLLPWSGKGQILATGAYVVRGTVAIRPQAGWRGPQGEPLLVSPVERTFTSRFGYLRKP